MFEKVGLFNENEKSKPLVKDRVKLEVSHRINILEENKLVLELKSVEALNDLYFAQTLNYLKLGGYKLGLLV